MGLRGLFRLWRQEEHWQYLRPLWAWLGPLEEAAAGFDRGGCAQFLSGPGHGRGSTAALEVQASKAAAAQPKEERQGGRGGQRWEHSESRGWGRLPHSLSRVGFVGAADPTAVSKLDLDKLRSALASCEQALGQEAPICIDLRSQLANELEHRKRAVPPIQQLQRLERKLQAVEIRIQKSVVALDKAEQDVQDSLGRVEEAKAQGRILEATQAGLEADKALLLGTFQASPTGASSGSCSAGDHPDSLQAQLAKLRATAEQQIESGDERAFVLGQTLELATLQLREYLLAAKEGFCPSTKEVDKGQRQHEGSVTPKARASSRSPRRDALAVEATAAAAAKAAGAVP